MQNAKKSTRGDGGKSLQNAKCKKNDSAIKAIIRGIQRRSEHAAV